LKPGRKKTDFIQELFKLIQHELTHNLTMVTLN